MLDGRTRFQTYRFTSNVEVLISVLWERLEEQSQESVDILSSSGGRRGGARGVGVSDVDWLIQENDRGVGVPSILVVDWRLILANEGRAEFHEQSSERGATRASVQPQDDGVVLWIISRFEEP
jgi:hypothetical protein